MSNNIEFKNVISAEEFCRLRESVGFQKITKEQAEIVLSNTSFIVNAVNKEESVGVVRILTDMITDAYITDVIVNPDFQGKGLGKCIVNRALNLMKKNSVSNVRLTCSLYANPGKESFYEKLGFHKLPNEKYGYGMLLEL